MLVEETKFFERGACRAPGIDRTIFFPNGNGHEIVAARKVCAGCPVKDECLQFALKYREDGVWGGTSERQRRNMIVRRY